MATAVTDAPARSAWLKFWQFGLGALPLAALAGLFAVLLAQKPDDTALLWRDPMGVKMLLGAGASLLIGAALFLGGCAVVNLVARPAWGAVAVFLQVGLFGVWVLLFCLPVGYALVIGTAAIQVQRNLKAG